MYKLSTLLKENAYQNQLDSVKDCIKEFQAGLHRFLLDLQASNTCLLQQTFVAWLYRN